MGLKEDTKDHRESTRSVRLNQSLALFIGRWNITSSIICFNDTVLQFAKLHEHIKDQLPKPQTLYEAYKDIIPAVIKKSKNPDYYIPKFPLK